LHRFVLSKASFKLVSTDIRTHTRHRHRHRYR